MGTTPDNNSPTLIECCCSHEAYRRGNGQRFNELVQTELDQLATQIPDPPSISLADVIRQLVDSAYLLRPSVVQRPVGSASAKRRLAFNMVSVAITRALVSIRRFARKTISRMNASMVG